jgi:hypothetical protein
MRPGIALFAAEPQLGVMIWAGRVGGDRVLIECTPEGLEAAIEQIAVDADRRNGDRSWPAEALSALASVGALGITVQGSTSLAQWTAVRAVACADPLCGRIFARHLEAVDRVAQQAPEPLRSDELDAVASGERVLGTCLGGVDRGVVSVREPDGSAAHAYVDSSGDAVAMLRPLAVDDELALSSRSEVRRIAVWAGIADAAAEATLDALAELPDSDRVGLAAGRVLTAQHTCDLWLADAALRADADPGADLTDFAAQLRAAVAVAAMAILAEAERHVGMPEPAALARVRRELTRVPGVTDPDPALAEAGRAALRAR